MFGDFPFFPVRNGLKDLNILDREREKSSLTTP